MFEDLLGEIRITQIFGACDNGEDYLAVVNDASNIFFFDLNTFAPISGGVEKVSLTTDFHYPVFIDEENVVVSSTISSSPKVVNCLSGSISTLNAQFNAFATANAQNIWAVDRDNARAVCCSATAGKLVSITSGPFTSGNISPSGLGSRTFQAIIHVPGTDHYIIGTDNGTVHEMEFNGTINKTITLPTSPNTGTNQTHGVGSLMIDGDDLYVVTVSGLLLRYEYSTDTLKEMTSIRNPQTASTGGAYISNVFNRQFIHSSTTRGADGMVWSLMRIGKRTIEIDSTYTHTNLSLYAHMNVNVKHKLAYTSCRSANSTPLGNIKFFSLSGTTTGAVPTRGQDPITVDVEHRILRFANWGACSYELVVDQELDAGEEFVDSPVKGANEIELSLIGTGEDESFDARRYTV